ncbi:hypothetical protein M3Y98_00939600 [Aphelenchoides besseyi]|nr:hypothetical protein M3Y98_00939600 [Aphelenchoides besseyi]KAI6194321.1 hypothetical protein M3Y96_01112700 [Aphelenchoides besseyi]
MKQSTFFYTTIGLLVLVVFCSLPKHASASWDGPVQTIEREETIQSANSAAAAQDDSPADHRLNHNRVEEEVETTRTTILRSAAHSFANIQWITVIAILFVYLV